MRAFLVFVVIAAVFLVSCAAEEAQLQTTSTTQKPTTTQLITTTTTTTTTSTTTTTTFNVPYEGKICGDIYSVNLNEVCGVSNNVRFYVVAPDLSECFLAASVNGEDALFITLKDYRKSPYKGLDATKLPIFGLSSNIAVDEVGLTSARFTNLNMNEVQFVERDLLVSVKTWLNAKGNDDLVLCTSEQTLDIAKKIRSNIVSVRD
jgi:hypothetical protein